MTGRLGEMIEDEWFAKMTCSDYRLDVGGVAGLRQAMAASPTSIGHLSPRPVQFI